MKILLATAGETLNSKIAKRFGEAPNYLIYDVETKNFEARINPGHDDGHTALIDLLNEDIKLFILGNTGPNAFNVLKEGGAKMYLARNISATDAIDKYLNYELKELTTATLKKPINK